MPVFPAWLLQIHHFILESISFWITKLSIILVITQSAIQEKCNLYTIKHERENHNTSSGIDNEKGSEE